MQMAEPVVLTNLAKWLEEAVEEHAPKRTSASDIEFELEEVRGREATLLSALESANAQLRLERELNDERAQALAAAEEKEKHLTDLVEKYRGVLLEAKRQIEAAEARAARAEQELARRSHAFLSA